jgi:N-acyl-D-amino-acid deacylase
MIVGGVVVGLGALFVLASVAEHVWYSGSVLPGVRITADQYPYVAGSTMFGAILPPWAHDGGSEETLKRLASPDERARMRAAMEQAGPNDWDSFWQWTGPQGIVIADAVGAAVMGRPSPGRLRRWGRADRTGVRSVVGRMGVSMIASAVGGNGQRVVQEPYVNVCTDRLPAGSRIRARMDHPRILALRARAEGATPRGGAQDDVRRRTRCTSRTAGGSQPGQAGDLRCSTQPR